MVKEIKVGLVGFGVVGTGFVQCLHDNQAQIDHRARVPIRVKTIADLDLLTPRDVDTNGIKLTDNAQDIIDDPEIDILVELVGGTTFAFELIKKALTAGKDVVTANKALLAYQGRELFELAESRQRLLLFEAAVGGGIPVIQGMRTGLCSTAVTSLYGILNGTANYILTRMEEARINFETALIEAKAKGYAEADPTFDIEGHDTCHKLVLLSELAFGCEISFDQVYREGISRLDYFDLQMARELGYRIKLLAIAKRFGDKLSVRVHPTLIPLESQLAAVSGVFNAVVVCGDPLGKVLFYGPGAGGPATGSAVAADVIEAARQITNRKERNNYFDFMENDLIVTSPDDYCCSYYLRLTVLDKPGVVAQITQALGAESISIASFIQKEAETEDSCKAVPIVITTHQALEGSMQRAIETINQLDSVLESPFLLRIDNMDWENEG